MLVKDEARVNHHALMYEVEKERHARHAWIKEQLENSVYCDGSPEDPTNYEARWGRAMTAEQVEQKLKKLIPDLVFKRYPGKTKRKMFLHGRPLMIYEDGKIPERSIMQAVIRETLDPSVLIGKFHLDRKDLPKHEVVPHRARPNGDVLFEDLGHVVFDDTETLPGMRRTKVPYREAVRGWRTMCALLVKANLVSFREIEKEFGADTTREWAALTGRRNIQLPW